MDIALLLSLLNQEPQRLEDSYALFSGGMVPVVLPLEWLPAERLGRWSINDPQIAFPLRVRFALGAGMEDLVWEKIDQELTGQSLDPEIERVLGSWAGRQIASLGLPAPRSSVLALDAQGRRQRNHERLLTRILDDMPDLFTGLPWPRWAGPVICVDNRHQELGQHELFRPALPILPFDFAADEVSLTTQAAEGFTRLVLARSGPPSQAWPPWLSSGLAMVAQERAQGRLPSPLRNQRLRQEAGLTRLRSTLTTNEAAQVDRDLAYAIVVLLTSQRRRQHLPTLLDLLRNRVDAISAISIAYGLSLEDMLTQR